MRKNEKGFTLIELLVVIAIIGILAAIAIPQFAAYKQRGYDSRAKADLHNLATAEEAYFVDNESYISCVSAADCEAKLPGLPSLSNGTVVTITAAADGSSFTGTATHPDGSVGFNWDSTAGGLQ